MDETTPGGQNVQTVKVKYPEARPFPEPRPSSELAKRWLEVCRQRIKPETAEEWRRALCFVAALTSAQVHDPRTLSDLGVLREAWWLVWTGTTPRSHSLLDTPQ